MNQTPKLPRAPEPEIQSTYVRINDADVFYVNFESSRILSITGNDSITSSASGFVATTANSFSSHYTVVRLLLSQVGFTTSYTGLTASPVGVFSLRRRLFDQGIVRGTLTATVSGGTYPGDYYDSGSGQMIQKSSGTTKGAVLNDHGMFVLTSSDVAYGASSITAISYKARVLHTNLNVFCKLEPSELNYSLNYTIFNSGIAGNWFTGPITSSSTAAVYDGRFTSSGMNFTPYITGVGLYDDNNQLLAIGKFSSPIRTPKDIPLSIHFSLDI